MAKPAPGHPAFEALLFGPFRLDRAGYSLTREDPDGKSQQIALRPKGFDVLRHLVENAGHIVSPDEFLTTLWPGSYVQPEVLKSHILAVRAALDDRAPAAKFIETVRGRGYRFVAEVRTAPSVELCERAAPELLVGRAPARRELDLALQRARSGETQMVFLTGDAGIGKTALAQAFAASARANDATVVIAHCLPGCGDADAYYPILEILTALSRSLLRPRLAAVLGEFAPTWLVQLPSLLPARASDLRSEIVGATSHRLARELCDALDALARNNLLLLVLEDIHWADQASLDLIETLANRRLSTRLMIVAMLRSPGPTEAGHAAGALAQKCSLYRIAREIKLPPLELRDVKVFLDHFAHAEPPAALIRHLHARSEGNPLFLRAMLKDNALEFPPNEVKVELVIRGLATLGLGQLETAFKLLRAARAEMDARNTLTSWYWRLVAEWGMTDAHLVASEFDAAEVCAKEFRERAFAIEERTWRALAAEACARVALARGRIATAGEYLVEAWAQIEGYEAALARWRLHAVEAMAAELVGDATGANRHRREQASELDKLAASLPLGHAGRETLKKAQPFRGIAVPR